jgi:hypothetical protein
MPQFNYYLNLRSYKTKKKKKSELEKYVEDMSLQVVVEEW